MVSFFFFSSSQSKKRIHYYGTNFGTGICGKKEKRGKPRFFFFLKIHKNSINSVFFFPSFFSIISVPLHLGKTRRFVERKEREKKNPYTRKFEKQSNEKNIQMNKMFNFSRLINFLYFLYKTVDS